MKTVETDRPAALAAGNLGGATCPTPPTAAADLARSPPLRCPVAARAAADGKKKRPVPSGGKPPPGRLHLFRPENAGSSINAIEIGSRPHATRLCWRALHCLLHRRMCFGSRKCRLRPQLRTALAEHGRAGAASALPRTRRGAQIRLANQDAGLFSLQDLRFDTVEANHSSASRKKSALSESAPTCCAGWVFAAVRPMTKTSRKVAMMADRGDAVTERVPLVTGHQPALDARTYSGVEVASEIGASGCESHPTWFRDADGPRVSGAAVSLHAGAPA